MQVFVRTHEGAETAVRVEASDTIGNVKEFLARQHSIASDQFFLTLTSGQELEDGTALASLTTADQRLPTLHLVLRPRGVTHPPPFAAVDEGRNVRPRVHELVQVMSEVKVELMREYSWAVRTGNLRWACPHCTAEWGLYPIDPAFSERAGGCEVAIHFGRQLVESIPFICHVCRVNWH